jgi:hypothetical protein
MYTDQLKAGDVFHDLALAPFSVSQLGWPVFSQNPFLRYARRRGSILPHAYVSAHAALRCSSREI